MRKSILSKLNIHKVPLEKLNLALSHPNMKFCGFCIDNNEHGEKGMFVLVTPISLLKEKNVSSEENQKGFLDIERNTVSLRIPKVRKTKKSVTVAIEKE